MPPEPFQYRPMLDDARFPESIFDPKAVTRASWQTPPPSPKREGPLVSFNQHPDTHEVKEERRTAFRPLSPRTKWLVTRLRWAQLAARLLLLLAAVGILVASILLAGEANLISWVLRVAGAAVAGLSSYAVVHLCRPARARTPASSAAYHGFATVADLASMLIYAWCALAVERAPAQGTVWSTHLAEPSSEAAATLTAQLVTALYWTLVGAMALHAATLANSLWLAMVFRRIAAMPPDMNPLLDDHLTSRPKTRKQRREIKAAAAAAATRHKHKSSFATMDSERTVTEEAEAWDDDANHGEPMSFAHMRALGSVPPPSFADPRGYGMLGLGLGLGFESQRSSRATLAAPYAAAAAAPSALFGGQPASQRGSYAQVADSANGQLAGAALKEQQQRPRRPPSVNLLLSSDRLDQHRQAAYEALAQRYTLEDDELDGGPGDTYDSAGRLHHIGGVLNYSNVDLGDETSSKRMGPAAVMRPVSLSPQPPPHPLRSNPLWPGPAKRPGTPFRQALDIADGKDEVPGRSASAASADIARGQAGVTADDDSYQMHSQPADIDNIFSHLAQPPTSGSGDARDLFKQPDTAVLKKYGQLQKVAAPTGGPPASVGPRQVSSGNDYSGTRVFGLFARRKASGRIAEEGRAGKR